MGSLWEKTAALPRFERLNGDLKTDVLIMGGGIAGILCAWFLQQAGVDYALVEDAVERLMTDVMYEAPGNAKMKKVVVTPKMIREKLG